MEDQETFVTVVVEECSQLSTLEVEGVLRAPVDRTFRGKVEALLRRGQRRILVDLAALRDIDAAGIGELIYAYHTTRAARGVLRIAHAKGRVRQLLVVAGVLELLTEIPESSGA